ncbi:amino acid ABC transporter permease [Christensenellaceae bacterium OttesenSCG-928-K19]|nr:amino acid ABC transporter permease [Christensenellaceae bacterium OttesenSCG-928-K19]
MFEDIPGQIYRTLIQDNRWLVLMDGLLVTLMVAGIAIVLGIVIGALVAIAKVNVVYSGRMKWLGVICEIYTTVIRGTPVVVQLLIMYFIIFGAASDKMAPYVGALAFGINSGAYVSEVIRAGIMSIDRGQMEAGRSLGLPRNITMRSIILPQAFKNVLPALGNEFIVLIKETSVLGFIAVTDLTMAAQLIRSRTFDAFIPLILTALIYLGIVLLFTWALKKLEKKLAESDAR